MSIERIPSDLRSEDKFHHIDMGFVNHRLCLTALTNALRAQFIKARDPQSDHMARLSNDHLLVTMLLDTCEALSAPTLLEALEMDRSRVLFRSTERLAPCPEIYDSDRVCHEVYLNFDFGKPVNIAYHTSHLVSDTGKMALNLGAEENYINSIVGLLHNEKNQYLIEPLVIGSPWFDHPRNGSEKIRAFLMWSGRELGEILPEDIDQFSRMKEVVIGNEGEWKDAMRELPESKVKESICKLLHEPPKKDWGGEINDHYSGNVSLKGRRRTAAFLLKGANPFREMTLDMCGKRSDQIHRLVRSNADISIVQHSHLIGSVVRETLRNLVIYPGGSRRKYCLIDGLATYRILKAYSFLD